MSTIYDNLSSSIKYIKLFTNTNRCERTVVVGAGAMKTAA